jgi:hypothetical protein
MFVHAFQFVRDLPADSFLRVINRMSARCSITNGTPKQYILNAYEVCSILVPFTEDSFLTARTSRQCLFVPMIEPRLPFSGMDWKTRTGYEVLDLHAQ